MASENNLGYSTVNGTNTQMSHVMRKPTFCLYKKTKVQISFAVTAKLISAFVFTTWTAQFFYFLNPKFPASYQIFSAGTARFKLDLVGNQMLVFSCHGSMVTTPVKQWFRKADFSSSLLSRKCFPRLDPR